MWILVHFKASQVIWAMPLGSDSKSRKFSSFTLIKKDRNLQNCLLSLGLSRIQWDPKVEMVQFFCDVLHLLSIQIVGTVNLKG